MNALTRGADVIMRALSTFPHQPGVYKMIGADSQVLYVGKAINLPKRVISYTRIEQLPVRLKRMVSLVFSMEIVVTNTEVEALLLENNLIKTLQPPYNILLKDDKSFPHILITREHDFPRILKHRGPQDQKGDYFGPFASVEAVESTLESLQKIFQLRTCTDHDFATRKRPCLQYAIKRCSAPCLQHISKTDYQRDIEHARAFLKGKQIHVQQELARQMQEASDQLHFEKAALLRDRIQRLTHIQQTQRMHTDTQDMDVIALVQFERTICIHVFFFRSGHHLGAQSYFLPLREEMDLHQYSELFLGQFYEKRTPASLILISHAPPDIQLIQSAFHTKYQIKVMLKVPTQSAQKEILEDALRNAHESARQQAHQEMKPRLIQEEMMRLLSLEQRPERIEVYDNSHLQGTHAVGVLIVVDGNGFDKKSYRKFNMRENERTGGGDDFAMMREVMQRRFSKTTTLPMPDLLLIDGGKGQIQAVQNVLDQLGISILVVGIAKGEVRGAGDERFFFTDGRDPITLEKHNPVQHFLQRARDEAHRFAITAHRNRREKTLKKSLLDDIQGIGPVRKRHLLQHFGSAKAVAKASIADLQLVPNIDSSTAHKIYSYFHEQ